jgi:hypothetical protein
MRHFGFWNQKEALNATVWHLVAPFFVPPWKCDPVE